MPTPVRNLLFLVMIVMALDAAFGTTRTEKRALRPDVAWHPSMLVSGSPVLFQISSPRAQSISAEWMGHKFSFFRSGNGDAWYGLAGIPVDAKAGRYELQLEEFLPTRSIHITRKVKVAAARYPKIAARVATKFTEPNAEQLKQIAADKEVKHTVLSTATPERLWSGGFVAPVSSPISDVFGTERVFNGEVQSQHLGLDFAAPVGTEVHAINSGTVILAQPLYFEGGFVVIDHGQGLLSLYLHLSEFRVKQGDQVTSGQVLGLSGSSGRATGPHLHLAVRWQGIYLNPAVLLHFQIQ